MAVCSKLNRRVQMKVAERGMNNSDEELSVVYEAGSTSFRISSSELFIPSQRPSFEHEQNNIISLYYIWNTARYHCRYVMNSADRRTRVMEEIDRLSTVSTHIPAERHDFGNHVIITRSTAAADERLPLLTAHNEQAADYFGKYHLLSDSSIMIIFMKN